MTKNISEMGEALLFYPLFSVMILWVIAGVLFAINAGLRLFLYGIKKFRAHTTCTVILLLLGLILRIRAFCILTPFEESLKGMGPFSAVFNAYYCKYLGNFNNLTIGIVLKITNAWEDKVHVVLNEMGAGELSFLGITLMLILTVLGFTVFAMTYGFLGFILAFPFSWIIEIIKCIVAPAPKAEAVPEDDIDCDLNEIDRQVYEAAEARFQAAMEEIRNQAPRPVATQEAEVTSGISGKSE